MGWDFLTIVECVACVVVATTAVGFALLVVELSREVLPALTEEDRRPLATW